MATQYRASHSAHSHSAAGRGGLLGLTLLASANHQSGPAGLQPSGLRPTVPSAGERALQHGGAVPAGSLVVEVEIIGRGKHRR
jgi:hypothetical protein